jgi:hypothetical protein
VVSAADEEAVAINVHGKVVRCLCCGRRFDGQSEFDAHLSVKI